MTLPASGNISWSQICTEFSLNPTTAVWPASFYGKGGAPGSGNLSFSDFYGRSAGGSFTPAPGTYTYTDNGQLGSAGGGPGASVTISSTTTQTWTYSATGSSSYSATLASGGSGTSIGFNLPAATGTSNRSTAITLNAGANAWNITLFATGLGSAGGGTCVSVNSLVLTQNGEKRAGDLIPGDVVYTRHETTGEWMHCQVTDVSFAYEPIYVRRGYPDATKRHRFGFGRKPRWYRAGWFGRKGGMAMVAKITVAGAHTYMARNPNSDKWRLSHNIKP
jgi:hypothetical protein